MDIQSLALDIAMFALPPVTAIFSLWFTRRWHVALALLVAAFLCWGLLLFSISLDDAAAIEAFNQTPYHTDAEIEAFTTDGASKASAFLFGVPIFLVYGFVCFLLAKAGQFVCRRLVHA
jgi:hypothetical protein